MANWFLSGISHSAVPYTNRPSVGLYVTTLIFSFTPVNFATFTRDIRDALPEAPPGGYGTRMEASNFWERFGRAVVEMPNLITFGLCYNDDFKPVGQFSRTVEHRTSISNDISKPHYPNARCICELTTMHFTVLVIPATYNL